MGNDASDADDPAPCPHCNGLGYTESDASSPLDAHYTVSSLCETCGGDGYDDDADDADRWCAIEGAEVAWEACS